MKKALTVSSGFTLIELMVVITIIVILSGISIASYYRFSQQQSALNDARNLATEMKKIQAMARNLEYPPGCVGLNNYELKSDCSFPATCQTMSASANCGGTLFPVFSGESVLSKGYFYTPIDIYFAAGSGDISPVGLYMVTNAGDPFQVGVTTDANGNIDVK